MDIDFLPDEDLDSVIRAHRVVEESRALRNFAKILGVVCVLLVICVFGVDVNLLEEIAAVMVHNVVAAAILIFGLNVATLAYDAMATPVPGYSVSPSTPLQGLVRRPSVGCLVPFRRRNSCTKRPVSITVPRKRSSGGGLVGGIWRSSKRLVGIGNSKRRSCNNDEVGRSNAMQWASSQKSSRKLSFGRRRGWPSGRLSSAGSI